MSKEEEQNNSIVHVNLQGHQATQAGQIPAQVHYYIGDQTPPNVLQNYSIKAAQITGWIQFGCGIAAILVGTLAILFDYLYFGYVWYNGIWVGLLFFLPTGLLGFFSRKRQRGLVITYMVMSILSSVVAAGFVWFSVTKMLYSYYGAGMIVNSIGVLVGFVELITAIVAAAFCCAGHQCCGDCCGSSTPHTHTGNIVYYQQTGGANGFAQPIQFSPPPSYNASQQANAVGASNLGANGFVVQPMPQMQPYAIQAAV